MLRYGGRRGHGPPCRPTFRHRAGILAAPTESDGPAVERNWQYFIYFFAGAALIAFLARRRGGSANRGLGMVGLAIFVVLGVLLLLNALGR